MSIYTVSQPADGFNNRIHALSAAQHEAIVHHKLADQSGWGDPTIETADVAGESLRQVVDKRRSSGHLMDVNEVVRMLSPIANALDFLHAHGIVQGDLTPEGIVVPNGSGQRPTAMMADFGSYLTGRPGNPNYRAPEQYSGSNEWGEVLAPTAASDNYALALIAAEMLGGQPLYHSMENQNWARRDRRVQFPDSWGSAGEALARQLDADPARRFPNAASFIDALGRQATSAKEVETSGAGSTAVDTQTSKGILPITLLTLLTVALLVGVGYLGYLMGTQRSWNDQDKTIAAAFSQAVPSREGGKGHDGAKCTSMNTGNGELAHVHCAASDYSYDIIDYGNSANRDKYLTGTNRVGWQDSGCALESVTMQGGRVAIFPKNAGGRFGVVMQGSDVDTKRAQLPLCS